MPVLSNAKHERFAQAIARGETATDALALAALDRTPFAAPCGHYVYALVDPRDDRVFYVGKGTGRRALVHEEEARRGVGSNALKRARIQTIARGGLCPDILIIEDGLTNQAALRLERLLIVKAHRVLMNVSLGSFDPMDRVAKEARENLAQIKPLCALLLERPDRRRLEVWMTITSSLARIARVA
jgi:hypothetical protein